MWEKWFAWYPIRINGNFYWLSWVYRREVSLLHSFTTTLGCIEMPRIGPAITRRSPI